MTDNGHASQLTIIACTTRAINAALLILVLSAASCHGYIYTNYRNVPSQWIEVAGRTYRVADKPDEGRMLVSQETNYSLKGAVWNKVVSAYFNQTNRKCEINRIVPISPQHSEYFYICS